MPLHVLILRTWRSEVGVSNWITPVENRCQWIERKWSSSSWAGLEVGRPSTATAMWPGLESTRRLWRCALWRWPPWLLAGRFMTASRMKRKVTSTVFFFPNPIRFALLMIILWLWLVGLPLYYIVHRTDYQTCRERWGDTMGDDGYPPDFVHHITYCFLTQMNRHSLLAD